MEPQQPADTPRNEAQSPSLETRIPNPLAEPISHLEDDPFWDEMMDAIRRKRRELDAAWDSVEWCIFLTPIPTQT